MADIMFKDEHTDEEFTYTAIVASSIMVRDQHRKNAVATARRLGV
jgi:hypothetical protein